MTDSRSGVVDRLHGVASRVRRAPVLREQDWLWGRLEIGWNRLLGRLTRRRGLLAEINDDPLRLDYEYGARYSKTGYEPVVHRRFTTRIEPGMTVLDVGAHVGLFALAAAARVGQDGRVVAFEPAPETTTVLRRHIAMNGWADRVDVVEAVATDHEGTVSFFVRGETMAASLARGNVEDLNPEQSESPAVRLEVPAVTLDGFCRSRDLRPDRIKIDVEGAELLVLRGSRELLLSPAEFLCEVHPPQLRTLGHDVEDLESLLGEVGRSLEPIDEANEAGIFHALLARA